MKAELLSYFGDDLMVVNAARVSYGKEKIAFDDKDEKLIKYLYTHKHTSVFRHPQLQFRLCMPLFVERQIFKHQVGISANSISGRYVDFSDSYYRITEFRNQSANSKQGSEGVLDEDSNDEANYIYGCAIAKAKEYYGELLKLGVSKEQARAVLPMALETQCVWTGSLLAFFHLCNLRLKPDAQQETRELVQMMLDEVKGIEGSPFKYSLEAFGF
jgi:thymidylate synthase (FAD)